MLARGIGVGLWAATSGATGLFRDWRRLRADEGDFLYSLCAALPPPSFGFIPLAPAPRRLLLCFFKPFTTAGFITYGEQRQGVTRPPQRLAAAIDKAPRRLGGARGPSVSAARESLRGPDMQG